LSRGIAADDAAPPALVDSRIVLRRDAVEVVDETESDRPRGDAGPPGCAAARLLRRLRSRSEDRRCRGSRTFSEDPAAPPAPAADVPEDDGGGNDDAEAFVVAAPRGPDGRSGDDAAGACAPTLVIGAARRGSPSSSLSPSPSAEPPPSSSGTAACVGA
jgi:hypothetical protein